MQVCSGANSLQIDTEQQGLTNLEENVASSNTVLEDKSWVNIKYHKHPNSAQQIGAPVVLALGNSGI